MNLRGIQSVAYHLEALKIEGEVEDLDVGDCCAWGRKDRQRCHNGKEEVHLVDLKHITRVSVPRTSR